MRRHLVAALVPLTLLVSPVAGSAQSPDPAGPNASGDPGTVVFEGSGAGGTRTAEFPLQAGDHRLVYQVSAPEGAADCGMGFTLLAPAGTGYLAGVGNNGAYVPAGPPYRNESWFHVPAAGSYALEVGGDCDWSATLAAVPSPFDAVPVVIAGTGPMISPSFDLVAGDHVVRYRATNPSTSEACIFFGPGIIDADRMSMMGDPVDALVDPGATLQGEMIAYGLPAGRYAFFINSAWCSSGLGEQIAWEVAIDPS